MRPPAETPVTARTIAIGPRLFQLLGIAYRSRRPALLVGSHGVGKSELLAELAEQHGLRCITIDLSLCEPADLVGLPKLDGDRTVFLPPQFLPRDGSGVIVFEELNRAEPFIQSPVLQLLTARKLNDYELPPGWWCVAAINPDNGSYDVQALDPAMTSRFLVLPVRADRKEWLQWAAHHGTHDAILAVVGAHADAFDQVPPRSWTYASDLLRSLAQDELKDRALLHDLLAGFLPEAWAVVVADALQKLAGASISALDLLAHAVTNHTLCDRLDLLRSEGRTDLLQAYTLDIIRLVGSTVELTRLCASNGFTLENFEAVLKHLPGDLREQCQDAIAANPAAPRLLGIAFDDLLQRGYKGRGYDWMVRHWQIETETAHRAGMFVRGLIAHLTHVADLAWLRDSSAGRRVLGQVLQDLQPPLHDTLCTALSVLGLEAIAPTRRRA